MHNLHTHKSMWVYIEQNDQKDITVEFGNLITQMVLIHYFFFNKRKSDSNNNVSCKASTRFILFYCMAELSDLIGQKLCIIFISPHSLNSYLQQYFSINVLMIVSVVTSQTKGLVWQMQPHNLRLITNRFLKVCCRSIFI